MRLDKWTVVIGAATIVATITLAAAGAALPGVLTVLAGAVFAVGWQAAAGHRAKVQQETDLLNDAARNLSLPRTENASPAGYLRPEEQVVSFRPRAELDVLQDWLISPARTAVQLVTGPAGSGKTRLAIQLAAVAEQQYGWRCYWIRPGKDQLAADASGHGEQPALLIVDYAETRSGSPK